jgi:hypothetical protein
MRDKEIVGLHEAYLDVYSNLNEEVENWVNSLIEEGYDLSEYTWDDMYEMYVTEGPNYDKNRQRAAQRAAARNAARKEGKTGNVPGVGYVSPRPEGETYRDSAGVERHTSGAKMPKKEVKEDYSDAFDTILEHLIVEGYADTNESALAIMANMSEEWRQDIMEISQKTATSAYAKSATGEFEGADDESDIKRTDRLRGHIERKFGKKAGEDADRHADSSTFGRKDPRTGKRQPRPQSRFQNPNKYRTTKDGKMHGQDQNKLKAKLERRRGEN